MTRLVVVLGAAAVTGALVLIGALAPVAGPGCPNSGDPVGSPIRNARERALIVSTFSEKTIDRCWPGTAPSAR